MGVSREKNKDREMDDTVIGNPDLIEESVISYMWITSSFVFSPFPFFSHSYGLGGDLVTHNFSHLLDLARKSLAADAGSDMAAVASAALGVLAAAIPLAACPEETEPRHALHWVNMEGLPTVARVIVATLAPRLAVQAEDVAVANDRGAKTLVPLATVVAGALRLLALYHRCDTHIRGTAGSVDAAGLLRAQEGALADALGVAAPVLRGPLPSLLYPTSTATSLPGDLPAGPFPASRRVAPNNPAACTCLAEAQLHATRGVLVDVLLQATALLQMTAAQNKSVEALALGIFSKSTISLTLSYYLSHILFVLIQTSYPSTFSVLNQLVPPPPLAFRFLRAILQDPEIQACLALPLWDQMFKAAVGAVAGPTTDGVQATAQVEGFAPAPLRLFAAQLENRCWRRAVALHNAAGATAKTSDVSLALLVQCPGGEAHQALDLLSLSPLGRRAGEPSVGVDRTGRVRASLRKMLLGGPLNDTAVQRDRKARSGMHPRNRASCFLPEAPHMGDEQTLPLSPLCMYWPLQMLYNAAAMVEVGLATRSVHGGIRAKLTIWRFGLFFTARREKALRKTQGLSLIASQHYKYLIPSKMALFLFVLFGSNLPPTIVVARRRTAFSARQTPTCWPQTWHRP